MVRAYFQAGQIKVLSEYADLARMHQIAGGQWSRKEKTWNFPLSPSVIYNLEAQFGSECLSETLVRWKRRLTETVPELPELKATPWQHQIDAYRFAYNLPGALLAHDMGVGKTFTSIMLLNGWEAKRVLVLCPLSVVAVWPAQVTKFSTIPYRVEALRGGSVSKRTKQAEQAIRRGPSILVINYEASIRPQFQSFALGQQWDVVILDECHHLKSPSGVTSKFAAKLSECATHRLGLSGTPMPHDPLDIYGVMRCIDAGVFGKSFYRFKATHMWMGGFQNRDFKRVLDPDEFESCLRRVMHRVEKDDVLDLPPVVYETVTCELGNKVRGIYKEVEKEFYAYLGDGKEVSVTNALVKLLRLQQMTSGYVKSDDGKEIELDHAKLDALKETLDSIGSAEPVVIFCRFVHDVERVMELCESVGRPAHRLSGGYNELAEWQAGSKNALVVQVQSGSEGIDLTRACYGIFFTGPTLGQYLQALARMHRPGQTRSVTNIHIVAENTVDEKVADALAKREEVIKVILEGIK